MLQLLFPTLQLLKSKSLLIENARGDGGKYEALREQGLDGFHWAGVAKIYGYEANEPSVDDFVLWMFRQAADGFATEVPGALRNIQLDFASLRNDRRSADALATLARRAAESLDYTSSIEDAELPPGHHLFRVSLADTEGRTKSVVFEITINP